MACNDETDGGRDNRDVHVGSHYSSVVQKAQRLETPPKRCRRTRLPPTSLLPSRCLPFSVTLISIPSPIDAFVSRLLGLQAVFLHIQIITNLCNSSAPCPSPLEMSRLNLTKVVQKRFQLHSHRTRFEHRGRPVPMLGQRPDAIRCPAVQFAWKKCDLSVTNARTLAIKTCRINQTQ